MPEPEELTTLHNVEIMLIKSFPRRPLHLPESQPFEEMRGPVVGRTNDGHHAVELELLECVTGDALDGFTSVAMAVELGRELIANLQVIAPPAAVLRQFHPAQPRPVRPPFDDPPTVPAPRMRLQSLTACPLLRFLARHGAIVDMAHHPGIGIERHEELAIVRPDPTEHQPAGLETRHALRADPVETELEDMDRHWVGIRYR